MILFKKDLSTPTPTWIARRTSVDPFATYIGTVRLADGVAVLAFCGAATATELDHVSKWMLELEAQHRANLNSEQIEKDLQPVAHMEVLNNEHADPHSRGDRFVNTCGRANVQVGTNAPLPVVTSGTGREG